MIVKFIDEIQKLTYQIDYYEDNPHLEWLQKDQACQNYPYLNKSQNHIKCLYTIRKVEELSKKNPKKIQLK